jgi:predicted nucleic acid-binding protein
MIVVDASALVEMLLRTKTGRRVSSRLLVEEETLHAPHLIDLEIAQVLRKYCAVGDLTAQRASEALHDLSDLPLNRYPHDILLDKIWELRHNMTAYDAAYVALAEALDSPLVTCDSHLGSAPGHGAIIEVI